MRDSLDIRDSNAIEVAPLIPDPPLKRRRRYRHRSVFHRCWNVFSYCSRWTCIFVSLAVVVLIIILCRSLLPFGWPSWIPAINYDVKDPHVILIVTDDLGWNDVGYGKMINKMINIEHDDDDDDDNDDNENDDYKKVFNQFTTLLEEEQKDRISNSKNKKKKNSGFSDSSDSSSNSIYDGLDDLYDDGETFQTPNIDSLAVDGIVLDRFYVSLEGASTRASVLTGRNGYRIGLQNGIPTGSRAHIPTDIDLISNLLSDKGYATHLVGKWNLGYAKWKYTPLERGFDTFVGFMQRFSDYWHYTASDDSNTIENRVGWDLWKGKNVYDIAVKDRIISTELYSSRIEEIINNHATGDTPDRPLFLMYGAPNPHTPLQYHSKYSQYCSQLSETLREKYCNVVQSFDDSVGTTITALKENNMYERSLIIIMSDNGGMICYDVGDTSSCSGASNYPLRAGKGTLFEGGLRSRALISGGVIPSSRKGGVYTNLVMHVDIFSTILGAASIDSSSLSDSIDGVDHFNYLCTSSDDNENESENENESTSTSTSDDFVERTEGILELLKDDDGNIIRGAYMMFPYKYIIQVEEPYDGWYTSPTENGGEVPILAKATKGRYSSAHAGTVSMLDDYEEYIEQLKNIKQEQATDTQSEKESQTSVQVEANSNVNEGKTNSAQFGTFDSIDSNSGIKTMTYNEYIFDVVKDEFEENNLVESHPSMVKDIRTILMKEAQSVHYSTPQDSTAQPEASPMFYDNVWYPFL